MNIKDLKSLIENLPDDMPVLFEDKGGFPAFEPKFLGEKVFFISKQDGKIFGIRSVGHFDCDGIDFLETQTFWISC